MKLFSFYLLMQQNLLYILKHIHKYNCIFEDRPAKFKFGIKNYGDIPNTLNKADGDPWDIFAPGYNNTSLPINKKFKIKKAIGVLFLQDGNHKIAVRIQKTPFISKHLELKNALNYSHKYCKYMKLNGKFFSF